jgi:xylulokinase
MGVRHDLEAFDAARPDPAGWRAVALGGGPAGSLRPQLVSDVTGRAQDVPAQTIGASYGDALLAAAAMGMIAAGTDWTKIAGTVGPRPELAEPYDRRYTVHRDYSLPPGRRTTGCDEMPPP